MKLVSWNVNGIRACVKKGFLDYFQQVDADIFCLQETKLQENQIELNWKVIISFGIMQNEKDILERLSLQRKNH